MRRKRRGGGDIGHESWAELDCAQKASSPHFWAQPSLYSVQEWRERNPNLQRRCGSHAASTNVAIADAAAELVSPFAQLTR